VPPKGRPYSVRRGRSSPHCARWQCACCPSCYQGCSECSPRQ